MKEDIEKVEGTMVPAYKVRRGKVRPNFLGDFDKMRGYKALEGMAFEGESFCALKDVPVGVNPKSEKGADYWMKMAARGEDLYNAFVRRGKFEGSEDEFYAMWEKRLTDSKEAVDGANKAKDMANTAAGKAETAASSANTYAREAKTAASSAKSAATGAAGAAKLATTAADSANSAASKAMSAKAATENASKDMTHAANEAIENLNNTTSKKITELDTSFSNYVAESDKKINAEIDKAKTAAESANTAAETANTAASTIDEKIKPITDNDKLQDEKLRTLEGQMAVSEEVSAQALLEQANDVEGLKKVITSILTGTVYLPNVLTRKVQIDGCDSVLFGEDVPSTAPEFIGQEYIDTAHKIAYKACGKENISDWKPINVA